MHTPSKPTFLNVAATHFVPCFFAGAIILLVARGLALPSLFPNGIPGEVIRSALNGLAVAGLTLLFHRRGKPLPSDGRFGEAQAACLRLAVAIGFLGGAAGVLLTAGIWTVVALTSIIWAILIWNLRSFLRHIVIMLRPAGTITWRDVGELMRIYLTMLLGFALVNAALDGLHVLAGAQHAFGFNGNGDGFVNALYFTVVTMTTLGFGDIVPATWDAKWLLIFQSLVSYFMFALMVGIITRGVTGGDDAG